MLTALEDKSPVFRALAVTAIGQLGPDVPGAVGPLCVALNDKSVQVPAAWPRWPWEWWAAPPRKPWRACAALKDGSPRGAPGGSRGADETRPRGRGALKKALVDEKPAVPPQAELALKNSRGHSMKPSPTPCSTCWSALFPRCGPRPSRRWPRVAPLSRQYDVRWPAPPGELGRHPAAQGGGRRAGLGPGLGSVYPLLEALKDSDDEVHRAAIDALAKLGVIRYGDWPAP